MGRKCCVTNCNGNDNYSKETVFRLPKNKEEKSG